MEKLYNKVTKTKAKNHSPITKRILTIAIAMSMLLQIFSLGIINSTITSHADSAYDSKMNAFINNPNWRNGTSWSAIRPKANSGWNCTGCCAYCADFINQVYGITGRAWEHNAWVSYGAQGIQEGDVIQTTNAGEHWFVVLKRDGNRLYTAEGNVGGYAGYPSRTVYISWDRYYIEGNRVKYKAYGQWYYYEINNDFHFSKPVIPTPGAPSNVSLKNSDLGKGDVLTVNWGAGSNASSYAVNLTCTTNSAYNQSKEVGGTSASFTLNNTGTYKVSVVSKNSSGSSSASSSGNCTVHEDVNVKYKNWDDSVILEKTIKYGGSITPPAAPEREGYTFQGWSSDGKDIKSDTVITPKFTINSYVVKFIDYKGDTISSQKIDYGSAATAPTDIPTKAGYIFSEWNTDEYKCVKKALDVKAVYIWENVDLPIVTNITSAVRNAEATGYDISIEMTNFPNDFTKGKIITSLKTKGGKMVASETTSFSLKDSTDYSDTITVLYSGVASIVEVSMVGVVDDDTTGTAKSKAVTKAIDIGNKWSDWSDTPSPEGDDIISESRTEYRYMERKTIKATSKPSTPAGYTYDSSESTGTYTDYGSWSGWTTSAISSSSTRQVSTRTTYRIYAWKCPSCGTHDPFGGACSNCGASVYWDETYIETRGYNAGYTTSGSWTGRGRISYNGGWWYFELDGVNNGYTGTGQPSRTEYRYRDKQLYYNYFYWPTSYSEWQTKEVSASTTCKVETRKVNRFKTNSTDVPCYNYKRYKYQNLNNGKYVYTYTSKYADSMDYPGEWEYKISFVELEKVSTVDDGIDLYNGTGENSWYKADLNDEGNSTTFETKSTLEDTQGNERTVSGKIPEAAGKVATLLVYKGTNADPTASQIEYSGQTTIAADGTYSFTFVTREEPSVKTGDFIMTLGIEGSTNYIVIGTIKAPKQTYSVEFVDKDGNTIGEVQTVKDGDTVIAPEAPEVTGYDFVGWDTGLTNVHDNMIVSAQYTKKVFTVIFVDYDESDIDVKKFEYGDVLTADIIPQMEGKTFAGWIDSKGSEVTTVTSDMIVTAKYKDAVYTVVFLDFDGNILKTDEVAYGESAETPSDPISSDGNKLFTAWSEDGKEEYVTSNMTLEPLYKYAEDTNAPEFSISDGTYNSAQKVFMSCDTEDAKIYYYTTNTDCEDISDVELYSSAVTISEDKVLYAYAVAEDKNESEVARLTLSINSAGEEKINVSKVSLNKTKLELKVNDKSALSATVEPTNATDSSITWKSYDTDVVTVDQKGKINAVGEGTTYISATAADQGTVSALCEVIVTKDVEKEKKKQTISASETSIVKMVGDAAFNIGATISEGDGILTYSSNDTAVADVDDSGNVTIGESGNAIITVTASETDDYLKTVKEIVITVKQASINEDQVYIQNITFDNNELEMNKGDRISLAVNISPSNASTKTLTWFSLNENVATVSNGTITAVSGGETTVYAVAIDGSGARALCNIKVIANTPKKPVFIGKTIYSVNVGDDDFIIDASLEEGDGTLSYSVDDESIAKIDDNGKVTIVGGGIATVTVNSASTDLYEAGSYKVVVYVNGNKHEHTYEKETIKEATDKDSGLNKYTCTVCGDTYEEVIPPLSEETDICVKNGHTYGELIKEVPATCTEDGIKAHYKCSVCKKLFVKDGENYSETTDSELIIKALGHDYKEVENSAKLSSCSEEGKEADKKCTRCDSVVEGKKIDRIAHKEEMIQEVAPTCTAKGSTAGKKCSVCGTVIVAPKEIPALGHKWDSGKVTKQPTANEKGVMTYTCTFCHETKTEEIAAKGTTEQLTTEGDPIEIDGVGEISPDGKILTDEDGDDFYVSAKIKNSQLKKSMRIADKKTGGKYKITKIIKKNGKVTSGTVEYVSPYNKNCKTVTATEKVKIAGATFKVTSIGKNAFKDCNKLTKVVVGPYVTNIGANAFNGCSKLKTINIKATGIKKIGSNAFKGINANAKIKVPAKQLTKYTKLIKKAKAPAKAKITK